VEFWGKVVWPKGSSRGLFMLEEKVGVQAEVVDSIVEARRYLRSMVTPPLRGN
jgi:hypothetical protein